MASTHDYVKDNRNENIKIYINGKYFHRSEAKISVFDSGFLLGDGVWEGVRFTEGSFIFLDKLKSYGYFEAHKGRYNDKYKNLKIL